MLPQHNPGQGPKPPLFSQKKGVYPFLHLEMGFTEIQLSKTYQYLLVVVCTFTDWVEAYPIHMEKATEVSRVLAKEIIPWIGVPNSIRSDNRPAFVSQVIKGISLAVGLTWELHTRYHPQSSGQVERMNRTNQDSTSKTMSRDKATLARCITLGTVQN
jgi:transposase InsO family protein